MTNIRLGCNYLLRIHSLYQQSPPPSAAPLEVSLHLESYCYSCCVERKDRESWMPWCEVLAESNSRSWIKVEQRLLLHIKTDGANIYSQNTLGTESYADKMTNVDDQVEPTKPSIHRMLSLDFFILASMPCQQAWG